MPHARFLPVSDAYAGGRLIARAGRRRAVTPLFLVFVAIGGTDILFALDSIRGLSHRVPEISTPVSLIVIAGVLTVTTIASLIGSRRDTGTRARGG